jgi:hypothetical protein
VKAPPALENEFHFQYPPPRDFEIEIQFQVQVEDGYTVPVSYIVGLGNIK